MSEENESADEIKREEIWEQVKKQGYFTEDQWKNCYGNDFSELASGDFKCSCGKKYAIKVGRDWDFPFVYVIQYDEKEIEKKR